MELVRPMAGGDRATHVLELGRVVGRDAAQDLVRRAQEVAVEVDRPRAGAAAEAADEDREQQRGGQDAEQEHDEHAAADARQLGRARTQRSPLQRRAHASVIDSGGCRRDRSGG